MKLSRRAQPDPDSDAVEADVPDDATGSSKGRPTPKRRDAAGRRGPVSAPKTRKEAAARQRQIAKDQRTSPAAKPRSAAEQRAAYKRGDPTALPRRDQGRTRKLARDYVDSHRMLSNYLLLLFPVFILSSLVPFGQIIELVVVVGLVALIFEWYTAGRKLLRLANERFGEAEGTPLSVGWYMGSRAYLPRRWRLPGPVVAMGDEI